MNETREELLASQREVRMLLESQEHLVNRRESQLSTLRFVNERLYYSVRRLERLAKEYERMAERGAP